MMSRMYRRVVVRHFGSTRNFVIWMIAVVITIYVIDTYILTQDRLQAILRGSEKDVKHMTNQLEHKLPQKEVVAIEKQQQPQAALQVVEKNDNNNDERKEVKNQDVAEKPAHNEENKQPAPPAPSTGKCGLKEVCPNGKYAYFVKSGEGRDVSPTICFNGQYAMSPEKGNGKRGLNIVVINEKTLKIEDVRNFDTYVEDTILLRYLKLGMKGENIILAATQDEASFNLKDESKRWLSSYGSSMIDKLRFRDGYVMVGQRGLTQGSAIEKHEPRGNKEFADPVQISGCMPIPMGKLSPIEVKEEEKEANKVEKIGVELPNCGLKDGCGSTSFPVHMYTGRENKDGPKICIGGKYVLAKGLNDGGRGFNIVIVDPKTKDVVRVGHFDTYAEDSSNLEIFLEMMNEKEIILAVTHDDASKKLSDHAKHLFNELGSGMIQNVNFRDIWVFVGQKGIQGFGELEQIEFAGPGGWPRPIDKKMCVPTELKGSKIKPDPLANKNEKRRKFCSKYDGYGDFCETDHIDELLTPAPLTDKALENHAIFQVPIIIIPGLNHNAVRMQLETLLMNPGIKPEMVTVMFDEKFDEPSALAELFRFKTAQLSSSTKYVFQVEKALEKVWTLFPEAKHVIVLEEEVILGPDFLFFMAQCLVAVNADDSLIGVSAFNDNGYTEVSSNPNIAYRVKMFPGLGFLLKRDFYEKHMKNDMKSCCLKRSWEGWFTDLNGYEMIIPDMSRVYRRPYEGLSEQADFLKELFNRDRTTNLDPNPRLTNADSLTKYKYEDEINTLIRTGTALDTTNVEDCLLAKGLGFYIPETSRKTFIVFFEQSNADDYRIMSLLCRCFHLFYVEGYRPRGLHNGMLRFMYKNHTIMFIGSATRYYKMMPSGYKPIKISQIPAKTR